MCGVERSSPLGAEARAPGACRAIVMAELAALRDEFPAVRVDVAYRSGSRPTPAAMARLIGPRSLTATRSGPTAIRTSRPHRPRAGGANIRSRDVARIGASSLWERSKSGTRTSCSRPRTSCPSRCLLRDALRVVLVLAAAAPERFPAAAARFGARLVSERRLSVARPSWRSRRCRRLAVRTASRGEALCVLLERHHETEAAGYLEEWLQASAECGKAASGMYSPSQNACPSAESLDEPPPGIAGPAGFIIASTSLQRTRTRRPTRIAGRDPWSIQLRTVC